MTAMQPPQPLSLALFELAAELHRSGSGAVFEATDVRSGGRVAIKRKDSSELGERKLLEHEAVLLATLSHPNVAVCLGSFVERSRFYMVLEFVLWYVVIYGWKLIALCVFAHTLCQSSYLSG